MKAFPPAIQTPSLQVGRAYLLLEKHTVRRQTTGTLVTFVTYTACPAVVVVQWGDGVRRRCPREQLVEVGGDGLSVSAVPSLEPVLGRQRYILGPNGPL